MDHPLPARQVARPVQTPSHRGRPQQAARDPVSHDDAGLGQGGQKRACADQDGGKPLALGCRLVVVHEVRTLVEAGPDADGGTVHAGPQAH